MNQVDVLPVDIQKYQILNILDILISMTGNVGRVCLINQKNCLLNQRVGKIVLKSKKLDQVFMYQRLNMSEFEFRMCSLSQGGAQGNISKNDILSFKILLPSLPEQQKIADFLTSLDKVIESKQ